MVYVRFFHDGQKLPSVSRQRFDITPLPFGIDGIKRQRRFARPGDAGDDDQLVTGQVEINIGEVMRSGTSNQNFVHVAKCRVQTSNYTPAVKPTAKTMYESPNNRFAILQDAVVCASDILAK